MTPDQHSRAKALFLELCESAEDEQKAGLDAIDDPAVRREVASLLGFYEKPPADELDPLGRVPATEPSGSARLSSGQSNDRSDTERSAESGREEAPRLVLDPGSLVAGRYRIVGKLGHGGMGEIYRAEDRMIGETVALKFLHPSHASRHLLEEARMARQVTHPNVCRVFDIGEVDSRPFISMEYVDGENLSSLLQRIGRLPKDRTVYLARQLFAGLAAAHARGVLHRDLKPANIMIDGRGDVRITDFGIAGREEHEDLRSIAAGTPAYMAPEQILGEEVTAKSDLYSLGLVLYELCTGTYPFDASSRKDYLDAHLHQSPAPPSARIDDLDPVLERVILKCLDKDPRHRPNSALAVAAALPGADPLALAMAVGETPSPEMVAEAGSRGLVSTRAATLVMAMVTIALVAVLSLADPARRLGDAGLDRPPEVLAEKAREILHHLGWTDPPADRAFGFMENEFALAPVPAGGSGPPDPSAPGSSSILFWYRQSPVPLEPAGLFALTYLGGLIGPYDPPPTVGGQALVLLHPAGTLDHLEVRPPVRSSNQPVPDGGEATDAVEASFDPPDFATVLRAAGLDPRRMAARPADFAPPFFADARSAYRGSSIRRPDFELDVRTAAFDGKTVYFRMFPVTTDPVASDVVDQVPPETPSLFERLIAEWWQWWDVVTVIAALCAIPLARRNLRRGRGDRRGARRLAFFVCTTTFALTMLQGPHLPNVASEWALVQVRLGSALFQGALVWLFYLTLEPYVRRIWPHTLIAWTRLLGGRFRDPLVGRSVLVGSLFGTVWALLVHVDLLLPGWLGMAYEPRPISALQFDYAVGTTTALAAIVESLLLAVQDAVLSLLILVLLRLLLRRPWPATLAYVALVTVLYGHDGLHPTLGYLTVGAPVAILEAVVLVRFGLVAYAAGSFVASLLVYFPITLDVSAWYADTGLAAVATVALVAGLGAYYATAPRLVPRRPEASTDRRTSTSFSSRLSR